MTLTNIIAGLGLSADGTPTKTRVAGRSTIGQAREQLEFSDADIAYAFKVTVDNADDVATLTLSTGAVAQTTGTPTITDAGEDFEGEALPTLVTLYALLIRCTTTGEVHLGGTHGIKGSFSDSLERVGDEVRKIYPAGTTNLGTITITLKDAAGEAVEVVVIGKSS